MISTTIIFELVVLSALVVSLIYGTIGDIKSREISSYLFAPVVILSAISALVFHGYIVISILSVLLFLVQFLAFDRKKYVVAVIPLIILGSVFLFYFEFAMILPWVFEVLFALMVIGEILFGVGDIKAILSVIFATIPFSFILFGGELIIPVSFMFMINLGVVSAVAAIYGLYRTAAVTGKYGLTVETSDKINVDKVKFYVWNLNGKIRVRYKIPFIEFILVATLVTLAVLKFNLPL